MTVNWLRSAKWVAVGALGSFAFYGAALTAQGGRDHNSNAPVDVAADRIELQSREDRVVLSGNVSVTQDGMNIRSSRMTVFLKGSGGSDIDRIDATGGVTITKDDMRSTSNAAVYDLDSELITLLGNVHLTENDNRLNGNRLVYDLNSERTTIGGGAQGDGGRVTGRFTVSDD